MAEIDRAKPDKTLDVRGLVCPRPLNVTLQTLELMQAGAILMVIADDRDTRAAIPELCRAQGHILLDQREEQGMISFTIQKQDRSGGFG